MRLFFKRFVFFLIPILLILGSAEMYLRHVPTSYSIKDTQLTATAGDVQLLILGNSHATYGLDPRLFSVNAFNLASVNQSLYFDKRITLKYIDELTKLKYVLISVDYHSLYFSDEGFRDTWSYYGYGVDYKHTLPLATRASYLYGYKGVLALEFMKRSFQKKYKIIRSVDVDFDLDMDHPYEKGYVGKVNGPYLAEKDTRDRAGFFNDIVHNSDERPVIIADLENFIDTLKSRHITPILITLPCYGPYREFLDKKVMEQNATDIQAICNKEQVRYWDYFTMPLDSSYFYNSDHVNEKGAAAVTADVNKRVEELEKGEQVAAALRK
jgi:DltD protein